MTTATKRKVGTEEVVDQLRDAMMAGQLVPGQRLVEIDLSETYGASRSHVRAALAELTSEGLVERVANRGARVRSVSVDEALEITEVRAAIEALCAAKAASRITDAEIEELRGIGERMAAAVETGETAEYSKGNQALHARVIEISGQRTAAATLARLRGQVVRFQFQLAYRSGRPAESLPQHLAIIEGVCSRDPEAAAVAMREHLTSVMGAIRASAD
ncbi:MAG: GntR family transcriptional regulator [Galactobacter sp.]|uniref:GntR family transcriptional regulator n=1 Tax=Galactobacter sp. TaxID=2676125 RepID=UPI0025C306D2|nr:GntR family transcriptional regulator [Galactobacter sp.]